VKRYEKVTTTSEHDKLVEMKCDICGAEPHFRGFDSWGASFELKDVKVFVRVVSEIGETYPEGGSSVTTEFDICPKCFAEKLVPFIEGFGGKATVTERDW